jgi:uncharacterized protein (DUF58 family)
MSVLSAPSRSVAGIAERLFSKEKLDGDTRFLDPKVLSKISNLEMIARFIVEGFLLGLHKSPYHGFSSEFNAYRKYSKGDPFKFIDWKVVAKTDRLYIKQFDDNTNTRCFLLVDASGSMNFGGEQSHVEGVASAGIQKWTYARNLAAAFAYLLIRQGDAPGLAVFRDGPAEVLPPRGGNNHLHALYTVLSRVQPEKPSDASKGLSGLPERLSRRGLVILISDMFDDTQKLIEVLKGFRLRRHEVMVFQILTPEERKFPYRDNLEFVDAEDGQIISAQGSYIVDGYLKALEEHQATLKTYCRQNDIDWIELSTDELLSTALLAFLNKRQRMR